MPSAVPEIEHSDSGVHSIGSLDSSASQQPPSYADQQLAAERAEQAKEEAKATANKTSKAASDFMNKTEKDADRLASEAGKDFDKFEKDASAKYQKAKGEAQKQFKNIKKEAGVESEKAKENAKKAEAWAEKNKDNPVVIGNAVVITALAGLLGVGAYRLHKENSLTWNIVGAWAGVVGLFAVGDYYVSQYFFQKYPPKN